MHQYDIIPEELRKYLAQFGKHFNKKLCDYAVSLMMKAGPDGKPVRITPMSREEVDALLKTHGVELKNNVLYDHVFVANMVKSDQLGSSIICATATSSALMSTPAPSMQRWILRQDAGRAVRADRTRPKAISSTAGCQTSADSAPITFHTGKT